MHLTHTTCDTPTERRFILQDGDTTIETLGDHPTLDQLREAGRTHSDPLARLNLWDTGLPCSTCGDIITDRFSADSNGHILCWDCAIGSEADTDQREISQTTDPTKAVLSESALYHKNLCNYVINVATGCTHGCTFCYVPSTPNIKMRGEMLKEQAGVADSQREWGSYLLYRDDLPERLHQKLARKQTWKKENGGRGIVMISSGTDCYQDRRAAQITRGCVIELVKANRPVRILTRSPAVVRDRDVFQAADGLVTVGSSIPCLDNEQVRSIEPGAPVPSARLKALQELSDAGIPVYVSMSPTYPTLEKEDIRALLKRFKSLNPDVIFHEPINPRGANFDMTVEAARQAGQDRLAEELDALRNRDRWVEYSTNHLEWVEEIGMELDLPIHLWPDKQLLNHLDGEQKRKLSSKRESITSPETYPRSKPSA